MTIILFYFKQYFICTCMRAHTHTPESIKGFLFVFVAATTKVFYQHHRDEGLNLEDLNYTLKPKSLIIDFNHQLRVTHLALILVNLIMVMHLKKKQMYPCSSHRCEQNFVLSGTVVTCASVLQNRATPTIPSP